MSLEPSNEITRRKLAPSELAIAITAWTYWSLIIYLGIVSWSGDCDPLRFSQGRPAQYQTYRDSCWQKNGWWDGEFFTSMRGSDVMVAVFTGLLVWVGWSQAERLRESIRTQTKDMGRYIAEAKRSADAMEGVAAGIATQVTTTSQMAADQRDFWRRQMRAYVFLDTGSIFNVADPPANFVQPPNEPPPRGRLQWRDRGPIAQIQIKNSGHTPAHDVVHVATMVAREWPLQAPLPSIVIDATSAFRSVSDLPPLGGIATKVIQFGPPLSATQIADLRASTLALYIYGEIRYRDAFGGEHVTAYRYRHNELTGAVGISTDLTSTNEGNYSD